MLLNFLSPHNSESSELIIVSPNFSQVLVVQHGVENEEERAVGLVPPHRVEAEHNHMALAES